MVPFSRYLGIKRFVCDPDQRVEVIQQRVLRNRTIAAGDKLPRNIESVPWLANKLINVLKNILMKSVLTLTGFSRSKEKQL